VSHFYLDASAIVKRYCPEIGSGWIRSLTDAMSGHVLTLSEISLAEVGAALAVKHRAPVGITLQERDSALSLFLGHCQSEYELISVSRLIIDLAVRLTQEHKLRGYDAVQLASGLVTNQAFAAAGLPSLTFIAADGDLLTAAEAEGLAIDNPNLHP
jgi:predicted nucleic acid-binding protein